MICDYINAVASYGGPDIVCAPGSCPHYGNCLPVYGIRETPEEAVGEHTREKGQYYHNLIMEKRNERTERKNKSQH